MYRLFALTLLLWPAVGWTQPYTVGDGSFFQPGHYAPIQPPNYLLMSTHGDRTPRPMMTLSRTVEMQGCTGGLDSTCTAPLVISVRGLPGNAVQTSSIVTFGQNDAIDGPSGTNDNATIQAFAYLNTFSKTHVKQSVAAFWGSRRDCNDSLQDCTGLHLGLNRIGAIELQLGNFTEHDCIVTRDNLSDCTGLQMVGVGNGTYGGPGRKLGIAYSGIAVTAGKDQHQIMYACPGGRLGASTSCFDDAGTAPYGLRLRGTYEESGIDLSQGTFAGAAITMPASGGTIAGPVIFTGPVSGTVIESVIQELRRRGLAVQP